MSAATRETDVIIVGGVGRRAGRGRALQYPCTVAGALGSGEQMRGAC
ncbi:MAG TPA: hypothetical protein VHB79_01260 [Polyangiaceae bacterium]|nr:hypothetical protein [Polyangiaceae bacterium]